MGLELKNESPMPDVEYQAPTVEEYPADGPDASSLEPVTTAVMQQLADDVRGAEVEQVAVSDITVADNAPVNTEAKSEVASEPLPAESAPASPDQPIAHVTNRPAMMPVKKINPATDVYRQVSFNMPIGTVFTYHNAAKNISSEDLTEALAYCPPLAHGTDAVNREGASWQQVIQHGGNYIAPLTAMPKVTAGGEVSGDAAVALLKRHSGLGVPMSIELPASCIYLEVNSIPDEDLINFHFAFAADRIRLGRDTAGTLLSARSGVYVERLVRLILSHVTWTNVKNLEGGMVEALIRRIDVSDYALLVNGVMGAQWPDGFPWSIRCHDPACGHEEPRSLSFPRMHYIDRSMLTEKQLDMLVKKSKAINDDELQAYRDEFANVESSRIVMEDGIVIELGRTTMAQYFENTSAWVASIESQQNRALTDYATAAEREAFMSSQMQAQAMRRYRHYVKRVLIPARLPDSDVVDRPLTDDDYFIVVDPDTITKQMVALSTTDTRSIEFEAAVLRYIEDTTVGLVAYASEPCPVCKKLPINEKGEEINTLVPMAVDKLFFTVSRLKTQLLAAIEQVG